MKITSQKKLILLFLLFGFLASAALPKSLSKSLTVSLLEKKVQDLSFQGLTLVFYIRITNSAARPAYLVPPDLVLGCQSRLPFSRLVRVPLSARAAICTSSVCRARASWSVLFPLRNGRRLCLGPFLCLAPIRLPSPADLW